MPTAELISGVQVITLDRGRLDMAFVRENVDLLEAYLDEGLPCALDLRNIQIADSAGFGLLMQWRHRAARKGGSLALCSVPREMLRGMVAMKLNLVFTIYANPAAAIGALTNDSDTSPDS